MPGRKGQYLLRRLWISCLVNGSIPKDTWYFARRRENDSEVCINYKVTPKIGMAIYSPGCEIEYCTNEPEKWSTISVCDEHLRRVFRELHDRDLELPSAGILTLELETASFRDFVATEDALVELCAQHSFQSDQVNVFERHLADIFTRKLAFLLGNFGDQRTLRPFDAAKKSAWR